MHYCAEYFAELIIATQFSSVSSLPYCAIAASPERYRSVSHGSACSRPWYLCPSRSSRLHWLSVHFQIMYKVALTIRCSISIPIRVLLTLPMSSFFFHCNHYPSRQCLSSSAGTGYIWFLEQGRSSANGRSPLLVRPPPLPETVRAVTDTTAFKRVLKTHFFDSGFISSS